MMTTYTLTEEDIKLAIKDYCRKSMKSDETFNLNDIHLRCEEDQLGQIFSAIATPTRIDPQR